MIENQIKAAVEHYEALLRKQLARVEDMEKGAQAADLSKKEKRRKNPPHTEKQSNPLFGYCINPICPCHKVRSGTSSLFY